MVPLRMATFFKLGGVRRNQFGEYQVTSVFIAFLYRKGVDVINYILYSVKC